MKRKIFEASPTELTENILENYFKIEGKTATAELYFDTFSELIDQPVGGKSVEKLNGELFDKIAEMFDLLPRKYEMRIDLYIKDFGEYTAEEAEKIIKDNVLLKIYSYALSVRRRNITGLILLGGGVALLIASYFLNTLQIPQIFFDVINISGTLLVWESANLTLIERGEEMRRAKRYVSKLKGITVRQADRLQTNEK